MEHEIRTNPTGYDTAVRQAVELANDNGSADLFSGSSLEIEPESLYPERRPKRNNRFKRYLGGVAVVGGALLVGAMTAEAVDANAEKEIDQATTFQEEANKAEWQLDHGYIEIDTPNMDPDAPDLGQSQ